MNFSAAFAATQHLKWLGVNGWTELLHRFAYVPPPLGKQISNAEIYYRRCRFANQCKHAGNAVVC